MEGKPLDAGRVAILGGAVEFTIRNGVVIVLEGPGDIELKDDMRAFLHGGSAVVRVPKGMSGFQLDTPSTDVLDLGTEFAVRVAPDLVTDVQVYDGAVVATGRQGPASAKFPQRLEMGQAARFSPSLDQDPQPIRYADERFVRRIESDQGIEQLPHALPRPSTPQEAQEQRRLFGAPKCDSIVVSRPSGAVVIDGRLDEWQRVAGFTASLDGSEACPEWVDGRMMYDDECLYIAAAIGDPAPLRNTFDPELDAFAAWRGGGLQVRVSTDREQSWPVVANSPNYFGMRQLVPTPEQKAAAENPRLAHLTMWFHAQSKKPCLTIAHGMLVEQIVVNPSGFRAAFAPEPGRSGLHARIRDPVAATQQRPRPAAAGRHARRRVAGVVQRCGRAALARSDRRASQRSGAAADFRLGTSGHLGPCGVSAMKRGLARASSDSMQARSASEGSRSRISHSKRSFFFTHLFPSVFFSSGGVS
jgi:hypothetical protein